MQRLQVDLDSLSRPHWSEEEAANVAVVADFVQHVMNDHDFEYVLDTFGDHPYVQHSRGIPDGIPGLVGFVRQFAGRFPEYTYDVKHMYADGDTVIFHSHVTTKASHRGDESKGLNIIDTWQLRERQIADHWDAIQPLDGFMRFYVWLTGGAVRNENGVF
ncbi:MAG: nuclear transport factor 2 family protein [Bacteroidota bacterium]